MRLESSDSHATLNSSSLSFEDALTELQAVVARLESGDLSLDETIVNFKQGSELAARCQKLLAEAELRVTELTQAPDQQESLFASKPELFN
jgi:exodeoxyribonuclease VII small subunit